MELVHECLHLQLVQQLPKLVEVDAGPEAEGMRNHLRGSIRPAYCGLAKPGTDRPVDSLLEGNAEFPGASLQESRKVIVEREGRTHHKHH
jgi:hypothetical protein